MNVSLKCRISVNDRAHRDIRMNAIFGYILSKAKRRFQGPGIDLDAGGLSYGISRGWSVKDVTISIQLDHAGGGGDPAGAGRQRAPGGSSRRRVQAMLKVLDHVLRWFPRRLEVSSAGVTVRNAAGAWGLRLENLVIRGRRLSGILFLPGPPYRQKVSISGHIERAARSIRLTGVSADGGDILWRLSAGGHIRMSSGDFSLAIQLEDDMGLVLQAVFPVLEVFHGQWAPIPLPFSVPALDIIFRSTPDGLSIEQKMEGRFSRLAFTMKSLYVTGDGSVFNCAVQTSEFRPDDIAISFPVFSDRHIDVSGATGGLRFLANFTCHLAGGWKYAFQAKLQRKDFSFHAEGLPDLGLLKGPFVHTIRDGSDAGRTIFIGKENTDFSALDTIPEILIKVIVAMEDPRFYTHSGFDERLFGYALIRNFSERRISRGGSTITMQLVRNLFLHHGKDIYRKLEEVILTWMVEDIYRIPKERILEIYLNIIEFGPGVYGIREACRFYFDTTPEKITLTQCIVLSYIIPRPRSFSAALSERSPLLAVRLATYVHRVGRILKRRGLIGEEESRLIGSRIEFAGSLGEILFS